MNLEKIKGKRPQTRHLRRKNSPKRFLIAYPAAFRKNRPDYTFNAGKVNTHVPSPKMGRRRILSAIASWEGKKPPLLPGGQSKDINVLVKGGGGKGPDVNSQLTKKEGILPHVLLKSERLFKT